ncbi:MAG TPA: LysM peptidoglycan-binding domain-containing protein [Anaerolineales bacterium]|nr:LysM peptidoglycan-binding domain-containing protein [Anaerolineales bacterium]
MTENDHSASDVIDAYRKRRERTIPLLLGGLAVVLLAVGLFLVVLWITGGGAPALPALFASRTPTPSITPSPTMTLTPTITQTPPPTETATPAGPVSYVVEAGDNLTSIAQKFGVEVLLIMSFNGLSSADQIFVGQTLLIPPAGSELPTETPIPQTLAPGSRIEYVVKPGDNLVLIASKFNSTAEAIAALNKMKVTDTLFVGRVLIVPVGIATPTITPTPNPFTPTATKLP